jgi:hypothetical protein
LINKSETPFDNIASLVIHNALGKVFSNIWFLTQNML